MNKRLLTHRTPTDGIPMWKYVMMTMLMLFISSSDLLAQAPNFAAIECVCLENASETGNGQFSETIIINAPSGQTWTIVSAEGFYDDNSPAPPAAPTLYPSGTIVPETGTDQYRIMGRRIENTLYSIVFSNGIEAVSYTHLTLPTTPYV